jgi:kynurenine formamidase
LNNCQNKTIKKLFWGDFYHYRKLSKIIELSTLGTNEEFGFWYEANDFAQAEHCGTHTDAPSHFAKGKWRLGDIPLDRLTGPGVVIDISDKVR